MSGVGDDQHQVTVGDGPTPLDASASLSALPQELQHGRCDATPSSSSQVDEALRAGPLGALGQLVDLRRDAPAMPGAAIPDAAAVREDVSKTRNPEPLRPDRPAPREVGELHAEPDVGLVRAEAVDRLAIGVARERDLADRAVGRVARRPR